jgi:hypothetical protein
VVVVLGYHPLHCLLQSQVLKGVLLLLLPLLLHAAL